jgi:hypothetical protein
MTAWSGQPWPHSSYWVQAFAAFNGDIRASHEDVFQAIG